MAGLMSGKPGNKQPDNAAAGPMGGGAESGSQFGEQDQEPNVSPEEQKEYEKFVANGMMLLYDEKALPATLQMIKGDGNPVEGLGNALANIVVRIEDSAKDKGVALDPDVMYHGAVEILEQMVEVAGEAGIEIGEEQMEPALYYALDRYRTTRQQAGELNEESIKEDFQNVLAAQENGNLDEVLPGLEQYAQQAPSPEELEAMIGGGGNQEQQQGPPRRGLMRG